MTSKQINEAAIRPSPLWGIRAKRDTVCLRLCDAICAHDEYGIRDAQEQIVSLIEEERLWKEQRLRAYAISGVDFASTVRADLDLGATLGGVLVTEAVADLRGQTVRLVASDRYTAWVRDTSIILSVDMLDIIA